MQTDFTKPLERNVRSSGFIVCFVIEYNFVSVYKSIISAAAERYLVNKYSLFKILFQLCKRYALLLHGIAVAHRYAVIDFSIEVYRYAIGRANFVLAAVAFAYAPRFVVFAGKFFEQIVVYFAGLIA